MVGDEPYVTSSRYAECQPLLVDVVRVMPPPPLPARFMSSDVERGSFDDDAAVRVDDAPRDPDTLPAAVVVALLASSPEENVNRPSDDDRLQTTSVRANGDTTGGAAAVFAALKRGLLRITDMNFDFKLVTFTACSGLSSLGCADTAEGADDDNDESLPSAGRF